MEMPPFVPDFVIPILGALVAGGLIGAEREYRARPAGLRTHILVSLTSALLMLAAIHQTQWFTEASNEVVRIDPVRMAHGVLTGIGFLCGGVIFRENFSVHGLTTAASLWTTSALGMLYGVGFYGVAVGGTVATLTVLGGLRWFELATPQRRTFDAKLTYRPEAPAEAFRSFVADMGLNAAFVGHALAPGGETVEVNAVLSGPASARVEVLSQRLRQDPDVIGFSLQPR